MHWRHQECDAVDRGLRVAIVGGGFSGTIVLANLVEKARPGTSIEMFDGRGAFATGAAYGTTDDCHILNVQAGRMGAFASDHFVHWLSAPEGAAAVAEICPGRAVTSADYLPRGLYGRYLKHILNQTLDLAVQRGVSVVLTHGEVGDVRPRGDLLDVIVKARNGGGRFDAVVLASGNAPPRNLPCLSRKVLGSPAYVGNPWAASAKAAFSSHIQRLSKDRTILVLGTGLTAVDAVLILEKQGFTGKIIAVSRHGQLPLAHAPARPDPWNWVIDPNRIEPTALAIIHWLKFEARRVQASGGDWRSVFESLRPLTPRLWRGLAAEEQAKLLRRASIWNIHRHRMAPEVAAKIGELQQTGRLSVVAARITSATPWLGSFRVRLHRKGASREETLRPSLIINCTGPTWDVAEAGSHLFRNLLDRFLIVRSPNGAGIAIEPDGTARSASVGRIFALGSLLVGDSFESVAVPELRETARWVAAQLAEMVPGRRRVLAMEPPL